MTKQLALAFTLFSTSVSLVWAADAADSGDHHGSGLHYSYVEGGASRIEHDGIDGSTGLAVRGSWASTDNIHVFGGAKHHSFDEFRLTGVRAGVGVNAAVSEHTDFVARLGYEVLRVDLDDHAHGHALEKVSAASIELGLRRAFGEHVEIQVGARHVFSHGGETLWLAGIEYKFADGWAVSTDIDYDMNHKGKEIFLGVRKYF